MKNVFSIILMCGMSTLAFSQTFDRESTVVVEKNDYYITNVYEQPESGTYMFTKAICTPYVYIESTMVTYYIPTKIGDVKKAVNVSQRRMLYMHYMRC